MREQERRGGGQEGDEGDGFAADGAREQVDGLRVGHVRLQALQRGETGDGVLGNHTEERNHREARVLHFLHALVRSIESSRVERERVQHAGFARLHETARARRLENAHRHDLEPDELLEVHTVIHGTGFPPLRQTNRVGEQNTRRRRHGPAPVHELRLLQVRQRVRVRPESQRVKACARTASVSHTSTRASIRPASRPLPLA